MMKPGQYWDVMWNPIKMLCTPASQGCAHCWHRRFAVRHAGNKQMPKAWRDVWSGKSKTPILDEATLHKPAGWKKPRTIFVQTMGDLFHDSIPDEWIGHVFAIMALAWRHKFIVLTKRPKRMMEWVNNPENHDRVWPLQNVRKGISICNQSDADKWVGYLLKTPAAVRFLSLEPLLESVTLTKELLCGIAWCIIGSESGPGARPFDEDWARQAVKVCEENGVAVFYKQKLVGKKKVSLPKLDGKVYAEYPRTTV